MGVLNRNNLDKKAAIPELENVIWTTRRLVHETTDYHKIKLRQRRTRQIKKQKTINSLT